MQSGRPDPVKSALGAGIIVLFLSAAALPSPLELYGFNPRSTAMGGAQTAIANDYGAAFYNPGALTARRQATAGVSLFYTQPNLSIDLDRTDVPEGFAPRRPATSSGVALGVTIPLEGLSSWPITVAIAAYAPESHFARGEIFDPRTPQFLRYQNLGQKFVGIGAFGFQPVSWLGLGLGVQLLADMRGEAQVGSRLLDQSVQTRSTEMRFPFKVAPTAGIQISPPGPFKFGANWRDHLGLSFSMPSRLDLDSALSLDLNVSGTVLFTPEIFTAGVGYSFGSSGPTLALDVGWVRWSQMPEPSLDFNLDTSGVILDGLGLEERFDVTGLEPSDIGLKDVLTLRFGYEHSLFEGTLLRGGYGYKPTPAPIASGPYNYLDNDAHLLSIGAGFCLTRCGLSTKGIQLEFAYLLTLVARERTEKVLGDEDPIGAHESGGQIHSVTIGLLNVL